jgi:hypothetical protein
MVCSSSDLIKLVPAVLIGVIIDTELKCQNKITRLHFLAKKGLLKCL